MPYRSPVSEYQFIFDQVVPMEPIAGTERFSEAQPDVIGAVLTEAGRLCDEVMAPLQRPGDLNPAQLENGVVRTSPGFAEGYSAIKEGGWVGIAAQPEFGGMGLPMAAASALNEMMAGACISLHLLPLLSQGQIEALEHHASEQIKATYLEKLVSGQWSGTMNLTEPQAGSDVGALRTKAEPQSDGSYKITGQKIYIT
ncbi:MAG: acyl-CoA dehydrogenase family protein, partial [Pseudomonadota bacterium]